MLKEAPTNPPRSVKSIVSKYLLIGSTVLTFGRGAAAAPQLASLVDIPMAQTKSQTIVTPDKQGPSEKNNKTEKQKTEKQKKTEISIAELKAYQLKFKEKHGAYYEMVSDANDGFYLEVAFDRPIYLEGGKKALVVVVLMYNDKERAEGKTDEIFISLVDLEQNKVISGWAPDFNQLRKEYKEMSGKDLRYVHVIVEHDKDELGEYVQFRIIPADSKKAVEKGIIEAGMLVYMVGVYQDSETGKWEAGTNLNEITASLNDEDNSAVAQK